MNLCLRPGNDFSGNRAVSLKSDGSLRPIQYYDMIFVEYPDLFNRFNETMCLTVMFCMLTTQQQSCNSV